MAHIKFDVWVWPFKVVYYTCYVLKHDCTSACATPRLVNNQHHWFAAETHNHMQLLRDKYLQ